MPPPANMTASFAETAGAGVCRGAYAPALLREWHAWDAAHGSENEAVDCFGAEQLYVVFVVADGGSDLEHFQLRSFDEARSVLLQVRSLVVHELCILLSHFESAGVSKVWLYQGVACFVGERAVA